MKSNSAELTASVVECINQMTFGFKPVPRQKVLPYSNHRGDQIFDVGKLKAYLEANNLPTLDGTGFVNEFKGNSLKQAAQSIEGGLCGGVSFGPPGAAVSGSMEVEFKLDRTSSTTTSFAQYKKVAFYAQIDLPSVTMNFAILKGLLKESVSNVLSTCASESKAKDILSVCGPFYMSKAVLGGSLTMTSTSTEEEKTDASALSAKLEAEYKGLISGANMSAHMGTNSSNKTKDGKSSYDVYAVGGAPELILQGDEKVWTESVRKNPAVVAITLRPLYDLVDEHSAAHALIKGAFDSYMKTQGDSLDEFQGSLERNISEVRNRSIRNHPHIHDVEGRLDSHIRWLRERKTEAQSWIDSWIVFVDKTRNTNWRDYGCQNCLDQLQPLRDNLRNESKTQDQIREQTKLLCEDFGISKDGFNWGINGHDGAKVKDMHHATWKMLEELENMLR